MRLSLCYLQPDLHCMSLVVHYSVLNKSVNNLSDQLLADVSDSTKEEHNSKKHLWKNMGYFYSCNRISLYKLLQMAS